MYCKNFVETQSEHPSVLSVIASVTSVERAALNVREFLHELQFHVFTVASLAQSSIVTFIVLTTDRLPNVAFVYTVY